MAFLGRLWPGRLQGLLGRWVPYTAHVGIGLRRFAGEAAEVDEAPTGQKKKAEDADFLLQLCAIRNGLERFEGEKGVIGAAKKAVRERGKYSENLVSWQMVLNELSATSADGWQEFAYLKELESMDDLLKFVRLLVEEAEVTQSSFWEILTKASRPVYAEIQDDQDATASFLKNVELARLYTTIGAWHPDVFKAVFETSILRNDASPDAAQEASVRRQRVVRYQEIHSLEVRDLVELLDIFSRAGSSASELSGLATRCFNEARLRLQEEDPDPEWHYTTVDEKGDSSLQIVFPTQSMLSIIDSMARFSMQNNEVILRKFGRERLHPQLMELEPRQIACLCHSYSLLRWKHDTVFREVLTSISEEQAKIQRDRVLGITVPGTEEKLRFGSSEMALVAEALVVLRMYRGNNEWFRWGETYQEMLDVLQRRLETTKDLDSFAARPLAAAAYALGRAKRGSEGLCAALLDRMRQLLELDQSDPQKTLPEEPFPGAPQDVLERFMFGIAMMGPTKRKEFLNTEWLRTWMCNNYYKLSLSDIVRINRYLVQIRSFDQAYLEIFVEFFCENMELLKKCDIQDLTHTYNHARIGEEAVGRHFFWALGRQFQREHARGVLQKVGRPRPALERIG